MAIPADATTFIDGVLKDIGAPITAASVDAFVSWLANEQGGPSLTTFESNKGNPLGIQTSIAQEYGHTGDLAGGIVATAQLLKTDYPGIVSAFKTAPATVAAAVVNSPWNNGKSDGTGYGGIAQYTGVASGHGTATSSAPTPMDAKGSTTSAPQTGALTNQEAQSIDTPYTGPGAYKGFDLQDIPTQLLAQTKAGIDKAVATPGGIKGILNDVYSTYGLDAWMANVPAVRTLLVAGSMEGWVNDRNLFESALAATTWYKTTQPAVRDWQELSANDPAAATAAVNSAAARVTSIADTLGKQLTQTEVQSIAKTVASQSIDSSLTYNESLLDTQTIYGMVNSAVTAGALQASSSSTPSGPSPAVTNAQTALTAAQQELSQRIALHNAAPTAATTAAVKALQERVNSAQAALNAATAASPTAASMGNSPITAGQGGGDLATLTNQFTTIARNYYLNLSPADITAAVQQALQGDQGQGDFIQGAVNQFTLSAQTTAKQMYPALAASLGTTTSSGTDNSPYTSLAWVRNMIAQYTGAGSGDSVDLTSPQYKWILSGGTPPTAANAIPAAAGTAAPSPSTGAPTLPSADALQTYLMGTQQFQSTDMAKQMAWHVGSQITKAFGFN